MESRLAPEGVSTTIPYKGSVKKVLADLEHPVRLSYSGAFDLEELYQNSKFIRPLLVCEKAAHVFYPDD